MVRGFNRSVRNPMYLGLTVVLIGRPNCSGSSALLSYAAIMLAVTAAFVRWYEEPTLRRRTARRPRSITAPVPGWWPRRHPWRR